ncbi:Dymeclin [Fimicolochytrium jonesii]|uniref:Dymeclin n=1 Tax=Fimicolochytrium jonesii TaxID=1396493 RepID=UPI0022FDCA1E|nr:Dymeclin [Fimicolochytrium jonesii]KAI8815971.1 Dymeclin [Fimicolochytrium jonesii]
MNFIHRPPPPVAAGSMLYSAYSYLFSARPSDEIQPSPLGDKSALLFLLLTNQDPKHFANEFKEAIKRLRDSNVSNDALKTTDDENTINVSFRHIYQTLGSNISSEESCMILYTLLIYNRSFCTYIMSRSDPESLVVPLLKQIYEYAENKPNYIHLYILLVILLLLTQDQDFIDSIQKITIHTHPWYTERIIRSVSLGGFTILVLIRTVQANLATFKDVYCHTLCTAILANLANVAVGVHSVVAQRIVSFYEMVAKRYLKLIDQTKEEGGSENDTNAQKADISIDDPDTLVYGDLVALLLEMIYAMITFSLKHNPALVYALLQKREAFAPFREYPRFQQLVENIDMVIEHFHTKLHEADLKMPTTAEIAQVIERAAKTWSASKLKTVSALSFDFEASMRDSFFCLPYVWTMVNAHSLIHWEEESSPLIQGFACEHPAGLDDAPVA